MSFKGWLFTEALTWGLGAALGLCITGSLLWSRAKQDIQTYIASPPKTVPGTLYSAPIEIRTGQQATVADLAGNLLAAGYERVDSLSAPSQFTLTGGHFSIWTSEEGHPVSVPGGKSEVVIAGNRVTNTVPRFGLTLAPTVLATVGDWETRRTDVSLDKISRYMEPALLSMEDSRFREHSGVDPIGVARALASNLFSGGHAQGGSTLTQQLAKNLFLSPERTMRRKVREAFFAAALESELSKDELLELYLGEVYLGQLGGVPLHGIENASRAWFGVSAQRLSLSQAATIAGVISAPNRYSPTRHPERAQERRDIVLGRMVKTGAISKEEADDAIARPLTVGGELPGTVRRAPWAVDLAVDRAEERLGEGALASTGYRVYTTLQPLLQRTAQQAVVQGLAELEISHPEATGAQAALVAVRIEDGGIVALVGGRDYALSPFNRATHAWRQAGSTLKPLTVLAALDDDPSLSPITVFDDSPISRTVDGTSWAPTNYDGRFSGEVTLREAIHRSRNIPAVLLAEQVGMGDLQQFYRDAGLSRATHLPSAALGAFATTPLEMAGAYTAFAGGGSVDSPRILSVLADPQGEEVLRLSPQRSRLASARAAAIATSILEGVILEGTGKNAARYGVEGAVAGKTGTTNDYRDAWFVGVTPKLAVAVWVGRDRGTLGLSGSRAALPTWSRFVAASGAMEGDFPEPSGLSRAEVCTRSNRLARPACPETYREIFTDESVPAKRDSCDLHGGPLVEAGRLFQGIFGGKRRSRTEGN